MSERQWKRQEIWDHFQNVKDPFWSVTYQEDVTKIRSFAKKHHLSFYHVMIWAVTEALDSVEAFHWTIRDSKPVYLEKRLPSFTVLKEGSELFRIITMDAYYDDVFAFCAHAAQLTEKQDFFLDTEKETDELIFISCLPWLEITALTNEGMSDPSDSIPRITWGKYKTEKGKTMIGISFQVNHRLIDGVHIAMFSNALRQVQERLDIRSF